MPEFNDIEVKTFRRCAPCECGGRIEALPDRRPALITRTVQ